MLGTRMTTPGTGFDAVAIVVDWLDACRGRRLNDLLDLYDEATTLECDCVAGTWHGRQGIEAYWSPILATSLPDSFRIEDVRPEGEGVVLAYQNHEQKTVEIRFRFGASGKIVHTRCGFKDGCAGGA
jgi:hypothetical protein